MNESSCCISKKTNCPDNDKYHGDEIQNATHNFFFKINYYERSNGMLQFFYEEPRIKNKLLWIIVEIITRN